MSEELIRRSDAIKAVKEYLDLCCLTEAQFHKEAKDYNKEIARDILDQITPSIDIEPKRGEWIPCSERLPDDSREVLISLEWGIDIGTYERGEWRSEWINHYDDDNVLAWMPLPKPWKGADDES